MADYRKATPKESKKINTATTISLWLTIFSIFMTASLALIGFFGIPSSQVSGVSPSLIFSLALAIVVVYFIIAVFYGYFYYGLKNSFPTDIEKTRSYLNILLVVSIIIGILNFSNIIGLIIFFAASYFYYQAREAADMIIAGDQ